MNEALRKEIVSHIFKTVGVFSGENITSMLEQLNSSKFLLPKRIVFETNEGEKRERDLWAATAKIDNSMINIIIADISDDISEFSLLLQMDRFLPCAMRLSLSEDDSGSMFFNSDGKIWIPANTSLQAKMLVGFESLSEIYLQWQRLDLYTDMYKLLISFLNFIEENG